MARGGYRPGAGRKEFSGFYGEKTKPVRLPISMIETIQNFLKQGSVNTIKKIPFFESSVSAGIPLPANDLHDQINLHQHLIKNPEHTFIVTATGNSMTEAGINHQDLLVVDQSLTPKNDDIIVAVIDGDVTVKRFITKGHTITLRAENPHYSSINISSERDFHIWGVVTAVIHGLK